MLRDGDNTMKSYLMHHGILGQKWGVRRFENPDGTLTEAGKKRYGKGKLTESNNDFVIKKGSKIYRISNNKEDKTYDNKKYVSLNSEDHKKWQELIGDDYNKYGGQSYNVMYSTMNDLRIAKYERVGQLWMKKAMADPEFKRRSVEDTMMASKRLNYKTDDANDMLGLNFAMQTQTGKDFIDDLILDKIGEVTS